MDTKMWTIDICLPGRPSPSSIIFASNPGEVRIIMNSNNNNSMKFTNLRKNSLGYSHYTDHLQWQWGHYDHFHSGFGLIDLKIAFFGSRWDPKPSTATWKILTWSWHVFEMLQEGHSVVCGSVNQINIKTWMDGWMDGHINPQNFRGFFLSTINTIGHRYESNPWDPNGYPKS